MNTPRILLTSVAALLLPLTAKVHAQLFIDSTMVLSEEGGAIGTGNFGTTGTAFSSSDLGATLGIGFHRAFNVNDGVPGNPNSWIGNTLNSFAGIGFATPQTIASFAFGRDNTGGFLDRAVGLYTIQFTTDADPAVNFATATWDTIGQINLDIGTGVFAPALRHRFNLVTPVTATGFRLITPGDGIGSGAAIDELELFSLPGDINLSTALQITSGAGFSVTWDGNDGDHFDPAALALVPRNLATNAAAFTSSDLGPSLGISYHVAANVNDGLYGNANSWIGNNPNPIAGVAFAGGAHHVSSVAWGRDNGNNSGGECCGGQLTDRSLGIYTLQSLDPADNTTWVTLGTLEYKGSDDTVVGGGFTSWLRHQYSVATAGGGIRSAGIRLIAPVGGIAGGTAIDELEVNATTMTWTNAAATGKWNLDTDANFSGAADEKFLTEDNVHFGNVGAGNVTVEGDLNPSSVTVDSGSDYAFIGAGSITGGGSLTKAGAGTLVLSVSNTYTGATTVTGGTLSLQGSATGALHNVSIANGGTLSADVASGNNRHDLIGNLHLAGGTLGGNGNYSDTNAGQFFLSDAEQQVVVSGDVQSTIGADLHVAGTHTFDVANGAAAVDLRVTGRLSHYHTVQWGGIRKAGDGTMHLVGSMDGIDAAGVNGIYGLGGVELAGGTLIFSGSLGYSAFSPANKVGYFLADFSADSTLQWDVGNTKDISVNGNLRIRDGVTATFDTNGNDVTFSAPIVFEAGTTGALTKAGDGTLFLATDNSHTGATTVTGGTLQFGASQTLGSLNIGAGAVVTLDQTPSPAPEFAGGEDVFATAGEALTGSSAQAVPEPGSAALLIAGMLSVLSMRRRHDA